MSFDEIPTIPTANVYRAAHVSATRGDRELKRLSDEGLVKPMRTPTGRVLLSPADGKTVFETLTQAA
jgi:hypothetical protein